MAATLDRPGDGGVQPGPSVGAMSLRTRPDGYGLVANTLHWVTVAALVVQVVVGYSMDWDDDSGSGRGRGRVVLRRRLLSRMLGRTVGR